MPPLLCGGIRFWNKRSMMKKFQVVFQPSGTRGEVLEGKNVLEASRELGTEVESVCGGIKACVSAGSS